MPIPNASHAQTGPLGAWPRHLQSAAELISHSSCPMAILCDGDALIYNEALARVLEGKRPGSAVGVRVEAAFPEAWPHLWSAIHPLAGAVRSSGQPAEASRHRLPVDRDGVVSDAWLNYNLSPIVDPRGQVDGVLIIAVEVTDTVRAEQERDRAAREVQQRESQDRRLFDRSVDLLAVASAREGRWHRVNPAMTRVLGWSEEELLATPIFDLIHPDDLDRTVAGVAELIEHGELVDFEHRLRCQDGSYRWIAWSTFALLGEDLLYCTGRDVTADRRQREALQESEARLAAVLDHVAAYVYVIDREGCFQLVNPAYAQLVGRREEFPGLPLGDVFPPEESTTYLEHNRRVLESGQASTFEERAMLDGEERIFTSVKAPLLNADGEPWAVVGISTDVTARTRAEEALQLSKERLRVAMGMAEMGTATLDVARGLVTYDEGARDIFGLTQATFERGATLQHIHPDDREAVRELVQAALDPDATGHHEATYRVVHPDGQTRWVRRWSHATYEGEGADRQTVSLLITLQDITERRKAWQAITDREMRLRMALDVGGLATVTHLIPERRLLLDARAQELYGFEEAETDLKTFLSRVHPEDRHALIEQHRRLHDPEAPEDQASGEYRVVRPDGSVRWVLRRHITLFEGEGPNRRAVRTLSTGQDITDRKRFEIAQRDFLAMASHELRNPLAALKGNAQLMQRRGRFDEEVALTIVEQADHLSRLVRDLLDVTMANTGHFRLRRGPLDLVEVVRQVVQEHQDPTGISRVDLRSAPDRVEGYWDRDRLQQIMNNLLSNALKYSLGVAQVTVDISVAAGEATVSVADRGVGIPADELPRIFERFYRLEAQTGRVDGLGLGLDVTRALVEAHGGRITVESVEGQGSTFRFTLPLDAIDDAHDDRGGRGPAEHRQPQPPRARVLVVDDDPTIRRLLQDALDDQGYEVSVASDGLQALAALERSAFNLLVLDLMLPRLDGPGLMRTLQLRGLRDAVRVVVVSASPSAHRHADEMGADALVEKPFELDRLLAAVDAILAPAASGAGA